MPFSISVKGFDEMAEALNVASEIADDIASGALYQGAGIVADAITESIDSIATEPFHYASEGETRLPSPEEVAVLRRGKHGVAKFTHTGTNVNTSVGWSQAGYGQLVGSVVPVPLIANAIESGTSFMQKQPFMRKAINSSKPKAVSKMNQVIDSTLEQVMNGIANAGTIDFRGRTYELIKGQYKHVNR